jgi:hypothetical protein
MGVLARQDFAGVGDITAHHLRRSERKILGREALRPLFGGAHENRKVDGAVRARVVNLHFFGQNSISFATLRGIVPVAQLDRAAVSIPWVHGCVGYSLSKLTWKQVDMAAGTLTVAPEKTDKPLVQPMAGELRVFLASLSASVGNALLFPALHGRITGRNGGLSNEFGRLMKRAGVIAPVAREKQGRGPAGADEKFSQPAPYVCFPPRECRRFQRCAEGARRP